jgi:hypothetical protein
MDDKTTALPTSRRIDSVSCQPYSAEGYVTGVRGDEGSRRAAMDA